MYAVQGQPIRTSFLASLSCSPIASLPCRSPTRGYTSCSRSLVLASRGVVNSQMVALPSNRMPTHGRKYREIAGSPRPNTVAIGSWALFTEIAFLMAWLISTSVTSWTPKSRPASFAESASTFRKSSWAPGSWGVWVATVLDVGRGGLGGGTANKKVARE